MNSNQSAIIKATLHYRDVNSNDIFRNNKLSSQLLRNYTNLPLFCDVQPEDIEDITDQYRIYLGVEIVGDRIKKVRIRRDGVDQEVYVISIFEHKSDVDYDVSMQILHYMSAVWYRYASEQKGVQKGANKNKSFRYPMIVPVVYYEGKKPWTAEMHLKNRIECSELFFEYIPDYRYILVPVHGYSNKELIQHGDEMALIMMINKVQTSEDFTAFREEAGEFFANVFTHATEDIRELILNVVWTLMMRMNVPKDEAEEMMHSVEEANMGELFANMEPMDIQKERDNTAREKQRADKEAQRAEEEAQRAEEEFRRAEKAEQQLEEARRIIQELRTELNQRTV